MKTLEDIQMEIYELIQLGRFDAQTIDENINYTFEAVHDDYPEIDDYELLNYINTKAEEIYMGEYDEY
jgi:hypothetical protein